ncbi:hypothetical protein K1719_011411 [Acacia pycnantha]|nr:hypothetical protein K1719_011411 [Acacia pycnantha]
MASLSACNFYIWCLHKEHVARNGLKDTFLVVLLVGHWILIIVEVFNKVVCDYAVNKGLACSSLKGKGIAFAYKWKRVVCTRQPDRSSYCGYYVMKFIKDVVTHNPCSIDTKGYFVFVCSTLRIVILSNICLDKLKKS